VTTFMFWFAIFYSVISTLMMIFVYVMCIPLHFSIYKLAGYRWRVHLHFRPFDFWIGAYFAAKACVLYVCPVPMLCVRISREARKCS
jgi:hypothetical protein